jgi:hypothetical protein
LLLKQADAARGDFERALHIDPCAFEARLNAKRMGLALPSAAAMPVYAGRTTGSQRRVTRMYVLECELLTPASIDETFAVFADPYNLAKITPPSLGFQILTPGLKMRRASRSTICFDGSGCR